jgi:hypothetical protein
MSVSVISRVRFLLPYLSPTGDLFADLLLALLGLVVEEFIREP